MGRREVVEVGEAPLVILFMSTSMDRLEAEYRYLESP